MVWSFGGHLYDENYNPTVNTPEAVAGTQFLKDMLAYAPEGALSVSIREYYFDWQPREPATFTIECLDVDAIEGSAALVWQASWRRPSVASQTPVRSRY